MASFELVEGVMLTWDKGEIIRADLLDRSKAFYKVDRGILLNKVEYYGV